MSGSLLALADPSHPQESLGGNAKTVLLVCVADVREHADETLQSLQFAARAMCVKNKPVVNERLNYKVSSGRTASHSAWECPEELRYLSKHHITQSADVMLVAYCVSA